MIDEIALLSKKLRDAGIPVSVRSTQSAVITYNNLTDEDRNILRTALRSIYIKDKYDIPKFNKIFDELFRPNDEFEQEAKSKTNEKFT